MSRTWPLRLRVNSTTAHIVGRLTLTEVHEHLSLDLDFGLAEMSGITVGEDEARELRDWLNWWLAEGPEPGDPP